jgi:hypothetical protein
MCCVHESSRNLGRRFINQVQEQDPVQLSQGPFKSYWCSTSVPLAEVTMQHAHLPARPWKNSSLRAAMAA